MTLKQHETQINRLQQRIAELVEELRQTQGELKTFKKRVAYDMKNVLEHLQEQQRTRTIR
tara:strand:- start:729 stop:908 length:180 start_codon:yes stop_codon:yes gene_type:complete